MDDMSREDKAFVFISSYFYPHFEFLTTQGFTLSTVMNKKSAHLEN
jgi:hypothetical protein